MSRPIENRVARQIEAYVRARMSHAVGNYHATLAIVDRVLQDTSAFVLDDHYRLKFRFLGGWAAHAMGECGLVKTHLELVRAESKLDSIAQCEFDLLEAALAQSEAQYAQAIERLKVIEPVLAPSAEHDLYGEYSLLSGAAQTRKGNLRRALDEYENAAAAFRRADNLAGLARALMNKSLILRTKGYLSAARETLQEANAVQARMDQPRFRALYSLNLSVLEFACGDYRAALAAASNSLRVSNETSMHKQAARAELSRGRALVVLGEHRLADMSIRSALAICQQHNFVREEILGYEFLGDLARAQGDWRTARKEWERALMIGERIAPRGDVTGEPTRRLAEAALHDAEIADDTASRANHTQEALRFARWAFDVNRSCGDRKEEASTLRVLGDIARARGRVVAAERAYRASIAMLSEMGARGELALSQRALDDMNPTPNAERPSVGSDPLPVAPTAPPRRRGRPPRSSSTSGGATASPQPTANASTPNYSARARRRRAADTSAIDAIISSFTKDGSLIPLLRETPDSNIAFTIPEEGWSFLTSDPLVLYLVQQLRTVAPLDGTVLLLGETGTGKELLARLVHTASGRTGAFVAANASAFPDSLVESELFGHIRGAFTGAAHDKKGLFEVAHGGTFFLDEVGDLPMPTQAKLLRTLEEKAVKRVGATESRRIDVRFVAATNVDLRHEMEAGRFRRDLYYRLAAHEFDIPPLRKRGSDALLLTRDMLARRARQCGKRISGIDADAARALLAYRWPGNVRELDNEMQRAATLVPDGGPLVPSHLSSRVRAALDANASPEGLVGDVEQLERTRIEAALAATGGNQARAGALLGMSRQLLRYKLMKYQLKPRTSR